MGPGKLPNDRPKLPSWHYWVYWAGVLCAITAALTAFGIVSWKSTEHKYDRIAAAYRAHANGSTGDVEIPERRLYPYSVIPGGVRSAQELRNAIANDPLVAALYANFDLSRAHIVRVAHDREVYVSYRLNGHIYWTKKRLLLRAGETLISDGKHEARTRCGNRISETPVQPVSPAEPTSAAMNAPASYNLVAENSAAPPTLPDQTPSLDPASPLDLPPNVPLPTPIANQPISMIPPPYFPTVGGGPSSNPQIIPPPPVATPEPNGLSLLGMGLLALGLAGTFKAYRKGRKA
ncbi:MAG TPA: hypothetical protein VNK23_14140 [Candidatus Dormibacteraeota bacterium]|nr:hypothetical protein [Candidatus Dormibacteraeota bacterium]